ncbi:MAG: peptidase S41, partial [Sphingobacteriaceae bacterium]
MMKQSVLFIVVLCWSIVACSQPKAVYNGSFEHLGEKRMPAGWTSGFTEDQRKNYRVELDSVVKKEGRYALSISRTGNESSFGVATYIIPHTLKGKQIQLKGYLKTDRVAGGFAGLWMRIDGASGQLAFNNMADQNVSGTMDWKEYSITLPYDDDNALTIHTGGLLVGSGKMWLDDLRLYIDGKPVDRAEQKRIVLTGAQADTAFAKRSGIDTILLNKQQLNNLTLLGQVWGFLKYHHPAVAQGNYNMDAELFRVMPAILKAQSNADLSSALETWVDRFVKPAICKKCKAETGDDVAQRPDYGNLFDPGVLNSSLIEKLRFVLNNRNTGDNYYISMARGVGNPIFQHELPYNSMNHLDAGYRILSLYRYWNMIQYFYPYKHLIGRNWNEVLPEYITRFARASSPTDYAVTTLALISSIHDTHANIWSLVPALEAYRGTYTFPFQARFIQDKLTVTGYYADTLSVKQKVKVGDVISSIDGVSVEELIKKYLPLTAASNYATQLRDMPRTYLLRTNKRSVPLTVFREGKAETVDMETVDRRKLNTSIDYDPDPKAPGYKVLNGQIGYLFPAKYKNKDLPQIKKMFEGTKGIIVDMRCYP